MKKALVSVIVILALVGAFWFFFVIDNQVGDLESSDIHLTSEFSISVSEKKVKNGETINVEWITANPDIGDIVRLELIPVNKDYGYRMHHESLPPSGLLEWDLKIYKSTQGQPLYGRDKYYVEATLYKEEDAPGKGLYDGVETIIATSSVFEIIGK